MKKLYASIAAILFSVSLFSLWQATAQSPEKMSYQAVIRNSDNALLTNTEVGMRISILHGSASGSPVYEETQMPGTNADGLVSIEIGDGTTSDNFAAIDWADGPYFIKTETDPAGGTNYSITGTSQLLSVPYALHAKTADSIVNGFTVTEIDGSITNEIQVLSISNDTIYLTDGGFVKLPAGFDGQYGSLTGAPINVSSFTNDAGYLTTFTEVDSSISNEIQVLSISNDTIYLTDGGFVKLPAGFDGQYGSLTGVPINVSSFTNDAGYLTTFIEVDSSITNEIQDIQSVLAEGNDGGSRSIVNVSQITIGSSTTTPSTALEINSTQGALLLPRMTTAERDALTALEGMIIYNTDNNKFQGCSSSEGSPIIDQQNLTINNGGGENRAQSFTAGMSGNLSAIELPFNTMMGTTDVNITIRNGDGTTGAILHTQTFTIPGGGLTWYSFNISGVSVVAGSSYTIHVTEVTPGACGMSLCYIWGMDTSGDNYSGGLFYYSGIPYSGGIYDCAFKTYVEQLTTTWIDLH